MLHTPLEPGHEQTRAETCWTRQLPGTRDGAACVTEKEARPAEKKIDHVVQRRRRGLPSSSPD